MCWFDIIRIVLIRSSFNPTYNKVIGATDFLAVLIITIVAQAEADKSDPVALENAEY